MREIILAVALVVDVSHVLQELLTDYRQKNCHFRVFCYDVGLLVLPDQSQLVLPVR